MSMYICLSMCIVVEHAAAATRVFYHFVSIMCVQSSVGLVDSWLEKKMRTQIEADGVCAIWVKSKI